MPNSALNDGVKKLGEHASKQAGWLPLLALVTIALETYQVRVPARLSVGFATFPLPHFPDEIAIGLATLGLFLLGDAMDKVVFKRRQADGKQPYRWPDRHFATRREAARRELGLGDGSYAAALALIENSGKGNGWVVFLTNESAKFLRSLVLPFTATALWLLWTHNAKQAGVLGTVGLLAAGLYFAAVHDPTKKSNMVWRRAMAGAASAAAALALAASVAAGARVPMVFLASAATATLLYLWLKHCHIVCVYTNALRIMADDERDPRPKLAMRDVETTRAPLRLLFWDAKLVGSAVVAEASSVETVRARQEVRL